MTAAVLPTVRLRVWFVTLLALALAFASLFTWWHFTGGWVITAASMVVAPVLWIAACIAMLWLLSLRDYVGVFVQERTLLSVRAAIESVFACAAIIGVAFGQLLGNFPSDLRLPDDAMAEGYRLAFLLGAALSFFPAAIIAVLVALLIPRFWASRLSLISR